MGRTVKLLLYYFAYQLAFYGVFNEVYKLIYGTSGLSDPSSLSYISLLLGIQVVSTLAIGLHLIVFNYVDLDRKTWTCYNSSRILPASFLLMLGMVFWSNYLNELANLPNTMQDFLESMMHHPLGIIATVILAPLVEELLFRGAIQGHLLRRWRNPALAIFISSLIFGVIHGNPVQIPFAFIVGLALGWMYYITGSLVPGIFMHFINNGTAVLIFWLSGDAEAGMIDLLGAWGALGAAVAGIILTLFCIWYIRAQMALWPVIWNPADEAAEETD